ncbi:hypothetical protein J4772_33445 [Cohnella sp. LGH]|uniref:hypothetical protein n=1 Tax=Cohnella sp. LGH TaxID=1619153 RepID=UPI001AD95A46|nr:hypothetical protein [Cohnella sp. LGH]QTH42327.1 hypothetical protein J4772_33445 [Cohnella sp. LGH]
MNLDSVILGDNQFFGVNHMSHERGKQTQEQFKSMDEIKKVLYMAMEHGVKGVMFSTHPSIYQITDMMRADSALRDHFNIYVNVPYIVKYVTMVNEMGLYNTINKILEGLSTIDKMKYVLQGIINAGTQNYLQIVNRLIDAELNPFHGLNIKAVFLHNVLGDLVLGYNMEKVIRNFDQYIRSKYDALPAYGTLNYPLFCDLLDKAGISGVPVMTSVNKKGFLMNPSREVTEQAIENSNHTVIAMATLASGRIPPQEAYEYLFSLQRVRHVIVGLSSQKHADETFKILRQYLPHS